MSSLSNGVYDSQSLSIVGQQRLQQKFQFQRVFGRKLDFRMLGRVYQIGMRKGRFEGECGQERGGQCLGGRKAPLWAAVDRGRWPPRS